MTGRGAWADIDLDAFAHNVEVIRAAVAPAEVWAVVKADGYGHGAVDVARSALVAGATGLCVALVEEGVGLRAAGVTGPILLLSEQPGSEIGRLLAYRLTPTVYSHAAVEQIVAGAASDVAVHVNVDTGMQRVGVAAEDAVEFVRTVRERHPSICIEGIYTHLACADEPDAPANALQLERFDRVLEHAEAGVVHVANSAAALAIPAAHQTFVRAGIALYGISPGPGVDHLCGDLRPVMSLRARVSHVKPARAGTAVSYGWRHRFDRDTIVATLPIGYADGVPRRLGTLPDRPGADVLIAGRRCPIVGVVTMDQCMVDVGDVDVAVGDEVVLIGRQGEELIRAEDWADRLGTIGYEIVCGIGPRVPRVVRPARESP